MDDALWTPSEEHTQLHVAAPCGWVTLAQQTWNGVLYCSISGLGQCSQTQCIRMLVLIKKPVACYSGMLRLRRLHTTLSLVAVIHRQKGIALATSSALYCRMLPFSWFWFARVRTWRSLTVVDTSTVAGSRPLKWDSSTWTTRMWGTRLLGTILAKTPQWVPRWIRLHRDSPLTIAIARHFVLPSTSVRCW